DLIFQPRDNALVLGTHGRGLWVLDDVSPLLASSSNATALLPIHDARLMSTHTPQAWYGAGEFFAPNPDWNAEISYTLADAASAPVTITVADGSGKTIRTLRGPGAKGFNR